MKFTDKLKRMMRRERSAPRDMSPDPTNAIEENVGEAVNEAGDDFRTRENAVPDTGEIPSVNRRGNTWGITLGGIVLMLSMALGLMVFANSDKEPPKKRKPETETRIANSLPPLVVPPPPVIQPVSQPTPFAGPGTPSPYRPALGPDGKPILHWTERKMAGSLLIASQPGTNPPPEQGGQPHTVTASRAGTDTPLGSQLEPTITKSVSANTLTNRNMLIAKGTTLDCALETALDSSLPGQATCRLTRDVYSDNGNVVLLDRGSQLIGEYQGGIKQGQVRVFVLWTRAKTPNGVVVSLDSPGTDALGRTGLEGWVDNHFLQRFGAAILMTFVKDSVTALVNRSTDTSTPFFGSAPTAGGRVVDRILESTVNIPPTIVKNQGDHIQVMVARDLNFSEVYDLEATQ